MKKMLRYITLCAFMVLCFLMPQAMDVHAEEITLTEEEKTYELVEGPNYINITSEEEGFYTLFSNSDGSAGLLDGEVQIDYSNWWSNGDEVKQVYTFHVEANHTYRLVIYSMVSSSRTLALKKDSIQSAKLTKLPDTIEYLSGYGEYIDPNGAEITIEYMYGGTYVYTTWNNSNLIDWNLMYPGEYIYVGTSLCYQRMKPGEYTVSFSVKGYTGDGLSYQITVQEESSVTKSITGQEQEVDLKSGKNYLKCEVEEDGFYALMANREGNYRCCADYEMLAGGAWPDDMGTEGGEDANAVASVWMEKGKTYIWEIWVASDKTLKLSMQSDEVVSADVIAMPEKVEYFSLQHNYDASQVRTDGMCVGVTFKLSGVKEYANYMPTDLIDWNPILPDGLKIQEEGPDNEPYLAVGEWEIKLRVKGLDEADWVKYKIKVHDKTTITDYLTETETEYAIEKNKYFLYKAPESGYYGLLADQAGSVIWDNGNSQYWYQEPDKKIKSLKWMEKGVTYILEVRGHGGTMNLAVQPVTIDEWEFTLNGEPSYKWNISSYELQEKFELKCRLNGVQEYLFDRQDMYISDIKTYFLNQVTGKDSWKVPAAGENTVVIDCHLDEKNPSYQATVSSIGDGATEIIPIGEETPVTAIQPEWEWESKYGYYKVKIENKGWYDFSARNIQEMSLYCETNEFLKSAENLGEFALQDAYGLELEAGTYIIYCNNMHENPSILIQQGGVKSLTITDYKATYVQGIDPRPNRRIDFTETTKFTITDINGKEIKYGKYDPIWSSNQFTVLVDGVKWERYSYKDPVSYKPGRHKVELQYKTVSDSFEFTVQTLDEYTDDLQELTDGIHPLTLSYSKSVKYRFVPKESAYYKITSLDEQEIRSSVIGEEGIMQSTDSEDNAKFTKRLTKGKVYLLELSLYEPGDKSKVRVEIAPIPKVEKLELKNFPKTTYIAALEETSDDMVLDRVKLVMTYADEEHTQAEVTYYNYDDFNAGFDYPNISYEWEEPIDWSKPGVYHMIFTEETSGLSVTADISLITFEQAEKDGLTGTIEVGKKTRITPSERRKAKYYKLEGVTGGTYCIQGVATEKNPKTGYYTASLTVADQNASLIKRDFWNRVPGQITKVKLSADKTYYIAMEDYKENIFDWDLLISEEKEIESAKVIKHPTKESYYPFEGFSIKGMEVEITYSNGEKEIITDDSPLWNGVLTYSAKREEDKLKVTVGTGQYQNIQKDLDKFECISKSIKEYPTYYALSQDRIKQLSFKTLEEERYIFAFTPEKDGMYQFEINGGYNLLTNLCSDEEFTFDGLIWDSENYDEGYDFSKSTPLQGGHTYYYDVHFESRSNAGKFTVRVTGETITHNHKYGEWIVTQEATCEQEGEKIQICEGCDERTEQAIEALGHEWSEEEIIIVPTCTENGKKRKVCTRDGCEVVEESVIPKLGHDFTGKPIVEQEPGQAGISYKECQREGCKAREDETILPPEGVYAEAEDTVNMVEDPDQPTEDEQQKINEAVQNMLEEVGDDSDAAETVKKNLDNKTIKKLDDLYVKSDNPVKDSEVEIQYEAGDEKATVEGAALTAGKYVNNLSDNTTCKAKLTINQVPEEQIKGDVSQAELADKIAEGKACVLDIKLSVVDAETKEAIEEDIQPVVPIKFTIPIPEGWNMKDVILYHYENGTATPVDYSVVGDNIVFTATSFSYYSMEICKHVWIPDDSKKDIPVTCTTDGYTYLKCENPHCGKKKQMKVEALGHDFGEWTEAEPVTCTKTGMNTRTCSICGKVQKEKIAVIPHDYKSIFKPATCEEEGSSYSKCSMCGKEKGYYVIPKLEHEYSDWMTVAPTCTTGGYDYRTCSVCGGEEKKNETKPLGHSYKVIKDIPATCETDGIHEEQCERCKDITSKTTPATGHDFSEWTIIEGSCTTGGKKTRTCKHANCGKTEEVVMPGTGHVYKMVVDKPATCETPGSQHEECENCHSKKDAVEIPATGHNFGEWTQTKAPTALAEGKETRTCATCGTQETKPIKKLTAFVKLSATRLPLQVKKSTKVLKVTKMQKGDRVVSWKSSNTKVVKVHKTKGILTAGKKAGRAIITVRLKSGKTAKCIVTVQKGKVTTKSIKLSAKKLTLKNGKTAKLTTVLNPLTSQDKVTFTTSNKKIATVTSKGVIKAKKKGKVKITVKSGKKKVTCTVKVK